MASTVDGFTLVNRQRKSKWRKPNNQSSSRNYVPIDMVNETDSDDYQEFIGKLESRLQKCVAFLNESRFIDQVTRCLSRNRADKEVIPPEDESEDSINFLATNLANCSLNQFDQIVSYGIGRFSSSKEALYQLGLLLILKDDQILTTDKWLIYDPVFTNFEKKFLINKGFQVLDINEKGAKSISTKTLFYMPHCPLPMYNNLLWANWSPSNLNQIVLLGTSFNSLVNTFISNDRKTEYSYIINLTQTKLINEYPLDPPRNIYESFNDLSVHFFTQINNQTTNLSSMSNCNPQEKPIYSDDVFSKEMIVN